MTVPVQPVPPAELSRAPPGEASVAVAARVADARGRQAARGAATNAEVEGSAIALAPDARTLAETAAEKLRLSARGFTRVLRVSRTIADLAQQETVRRVDVAEALAFRHRVPGRRVCRKHPCRCVMRSFWDSRFLRLCWGVHHGEPGWRAPARLRPTWSDVSDRSWTVPTRSFTGMSRQLLAA